MTHHRVRKFRPQADRAEFAATYDGKGASAVLFSMAKGVASEEQFIGALGGESWPSTRSAT